MSIICDFESIIVVSEENEHTERRAEKQQQQPGGIKRCLIVKGNSTNYVHGHRPTKKLDIEKRGRAKHTQNDLLFNFFSAVCFSAHERKKHPSK